MSRLKVSKHKSHSHPDKLRKLRAPISRSGDESVLLIEGLIGKFKADTNDFPEQWKIEYAGAAETADGLEKENWAYLEKCQSRWPKLDNAGRNLAVAPRKRILLDPLSIKKAIRSWWKLINMAKTPAHGVDSDITRFLDLNDLEKIVEWADTTHDGDFNMDSLGKKLAAMWLEKVANTGRKTETQQEFADILTNLGADLRCSAPSGTNTKLRRLATVAGFRVDDFWREISIWLRRVFQTAFDWKTELEVNPSKIPSTLLYTENSAHLLVNLNAENEPETRNIPAILEDQNSDASTWLVIKSDPLYIALVQLEDNAEDIENQLWIWEKLEKMHTVDKSLRVLLKVWLQAVKNGDQSVDGAGWMRVREYLRPVYNEGNLRVVTTFHKNSVNQHAVDNLRKIMVRAFDDDIWETRRKLRAALGAETVTDKWTVYHDIKVIPKTEFTPREFTNNLLKAKPLDYAKNYLVKGVCARQECNRNSGNFVLCNLCNTQLTLVTDERRGSRLATLIRDPKKKVVARDRWTRSKVLDDVHPHLRASLLRDMVKIQRTKVKHGGVRDGMAAILAEKYASGCQTPWGHDDIKENPNILEALDTFTKAFTNLRKMAKWSSVQQMENGKAIFIPLREVDANGLRTYEKPVLVTVENGSSTVILLEDLPFQNDEKWVKIRVNLPFTVPEFISNIRQYAKLLDDTEEWPELTYCADFLRKTEGLEIAVLMEERAEFEKIARGLTEIVGEARCYDDYDLRYPQLIAATEYGGLEAFIRFDGYHTEIRSVLRPQKKNMTKKIPNVVAAEKEESIINFLAHLAISQKLVPGFHPENIIGCTTWDQSDSAVGATARRQELSVAFMALALDHAERRKLTEWKLCDGDVTFGAAELRRYAEASESFIKQLRLSDHPNGLQILEFTKICEKVRHLYPVASQLVDTSRYCLQPDARFGKKITKTITHDWNRFYLTGFLGRKRAIVPVMREFFQMRSPARSLPRPVESPQLYSDVRSNSWFRKQRKAFGTKDENGHFEALPDSDVSDFSEGEEDKMHRNAHLKQYTRKRSTVQKRAAKALERSQNAKPESTKNAITAEENVEPLRSEEEEEMSVSTELFEIGEVEFTDWADDKFLENDQEVPPPACETEDEPVALDSSKERELDLPQSMKEKIRKLLQGTDEGTQKAAARYVSELLGEQRQNATAQNPRQENLDDIRENPLFEDEEATEREAEERERLARRAKEQRYRRILCGEQDKNFVDWAELIRAKNEARRYFEEKDAKKTENNKAVVKTESDVSIASVELLDFPTRGPRDQTPTAAQELSQQRDRELARQQIPEAQLANLSIESSDESAITDSETSETSDSELTTVIENTAARVKEETEIIAKAAEQAVERIPEDSKKGLLKSYSGVPDKKRDEGGNAEKIPESLRKMREYDEKRMKEMRRDFELRNWDVENFSQLPRRASERRVSFTDRAPVNDPKQWQLPPMVEYKEAVDSEVTFGYNKREIWAMTKKFYYEDYVAKHNSYPEDKENTIPEVKQDRFGYAKIISEDGVEQPAKELNVGKKRLVEMGIKKYHQRSKASDVEKTLSREEKTKIGKTTIKLSVGYGYLDEEDVRLAQRDLARWALDLGLGFMRYIYDEWRSNGSFNLEIVRMSLYYGLKLNGTMVFKINHQNSKSKIRAN
ncbi:unnamed protein product [Oikopleura dioica]|uniref:Uncharacterized protein n=1 Tax=Oikopleura dioica TaxID=34765 RepID=E4YTI5_OIKDI|nr:unnamed protein product [Oikopleura dioica]